VDRLGLVVAFMSLQDVDDADSAIREIGTEALAPAGFLLERVREIGVPDAAVRLPARDAGNASRSSLHTRAVRP
jgi:hypothetical protein